MVVVGPPKAKVGVVPKPVVPPKAGVVEVP